MTPLATEVADTAEKPVNAWDLPWSLSTRIVFRFCFAYFGLYVLTTQMLGGLIPVSPIESAGLMLKLLQWSAVHIFHITATPVVISGSGDKYLDWIAAAWLLAVSVAATTIWSVLDRRRAHYAGMLKWFRVFLRFALGATFIAYGFDKVVPLQMPYPPLTRLLEPYGNFSMMGVLWSSIGASTAYEIFVGSAEALGGILLFIPRTALLGGLVCLADAIEVFTLNLTYDVPVKLFSFHLVLMSLFLIAPELKRLMNVLVLNRPAMPSEEPPLVKNIMGRRILTVAQVVFGALLVLIQLSGTVQSWHRYGGGVPKPPLYGIWNVDEMQIDGQIRAPLITDYERWRRLIVQPGFGGATLAFQRMNEMILPLSARIDEGKKTIGVSRGNVNAGSLSYQQPGNRSLILDGTLDGKQLHLRLSQVDIQSFALSGPKFHWIQEFPVNR